MTLPIATMHETIAMHAHLFEYPCMIWQPYREPYAYHQHVVHA